LLLNIKATTAMAHLMLYVHVPLYSSCNGQVMLNGAHHAARLASWLPAVLLILLLLLLPLLLLLLLSKLNCAQV
jgi:hypothetical protein